MRRHVVIVTFVLLCVVTLNGGAVDQPKRVMKYIAVMDITCRGETSKDLAAPLTEVIIEELIKNKQYTVIDRANRDKILGEARFQMSGCSDESCVVEAGKLLGAGKIVVGSVSKIGQTYLITLQFINVETATVESAASETCDCDFKGLINSIRLTTQKLFGETRKTTATSSSPNLGVSTENNPFVGRRNMALGAETTSNTKNIKKRSPLNLKGYAAGLDSVNDGVLNSCWSLPPRTTGWVDLKFRSKTKVAGVRILHSESGQLSYVGKNLWQVISWGLLRTYRVTAMNESRETQFCAGEVVEKKQPKGIPENELSDIKKPQWILCQGSPVEADSVKVYIDSVYGEGGGICEIEVYGE